MILLTRVYSAITSFFTIVLFLFQDPTQDTMMHFVVLSPQPPPICGNFQFFIVFHVFDTFKEEWSGILQDEPEKLSQNYSFPYVPPSHINHLLNISSICSFFSVPNSLVLLQVLKISYLDLLKYFLLEKVFLSSPTTLHTYSHYRNYRNSIPASLLTLRQLSQGTMAFMYVS